MEKIFKQIKFYFSITNLACDNFMLTKLIYEKHILAETLLTFNKLARLLSKYDDPLQKIIEICKEIPELIVTDNKISPVHPITNEMIEEHRRTSISRTIYFENIPDSADHASISSIFSKYGEIFYVSLPRFPESKILKGFGFIEFSNTESCLQAIEDLNERIPNIWKEEENYNEVFKVISKSKWIEYKERFQMLHKRLRIDSPEREYIVKIEGLYPTLTNTQIKDYLQIKPWKIEYKPGNCEALLIFANEIDKKAILKCQPYIHGRQVNYIDIIK